MNQNRWNEHRSQAVAVSRRVLLGTAALLATVAFRRGRPAGANATPAAGGATRTVEHALGTTEVPVNPQRVVALGTGVLEAMTLLGVRPVGAAVWVGSGNALAFPSFFAASDVEGVALVGNASEPNLETIAALGPDLMIGMADNYANDRFYAQASRIAPVVLHAWGGDDAARWKEFFAETAATLGKEAAGRRVAAAYDGRATAFRERMGDRLAETEVSFVRFMPDEVRLYLPGSYAGSILADCGLPRAPAQREPGFAQPISLERIEDADGDVMFVAQSDPDATLYDQFADHPLWSRLRAVQSGRVYDVDFEYWIGGEVYYAANLILDDLERHLLGEGA